MRNCNSTLKSIVGAVWCLSGVMLLLSTIILSIAGQTPLSDAIRNGALGLGFAIAGGWIAIHFWTGR